MLGFAPRPVQVSSTQFFLHLLNMLLELLWWWA